MNRKRKNIPTDEIIKQLRERYEDMTEEERIEFERVMAEPDERFRLMMERHDKQIADYYVRRIKSGADAMYYLKKFQLKK